MSDAQASHAQPCSTAEIFVIQRVVDRLVQYPLFSAILTVGGMTAIVSLASFWRDLLIANRYGVDRELDAFLIAYLLPLSLVNVLAASFTSALMPTYLVVRRKQSPSASDALFGSCLSLGFIFLVGCTGVLLVTAPLVFRLLGSGFDMPTLQLTERLFWVLSPILSLLGIARLYATVLNAEKRFAVVALAPIMTPILAVLSILLFHSRWGIFALAWGVTAGAIAECTILALTLVKLRLPLRPNWTGRSPELNVVLRQYLPMVMGALLLSGTLIVDQAMASTLETGSVAALSFGNKPVAFMLGIAASALGTSILPHFSHLLAQGKHRTAERSYRKYSLVALVASLLPTAFLMLFAEDLVRLLFEHGEFDAADTKVVAMVLVCYCAQIPFYLVGTLSVRLISAYKANQVLMYVAAFSLTANIGLNLLFMRWLGVAGIALSTSVVYLLALLIFRRVLGRMFREWNSG